MSYTNWDDLCTAVEKWENPHLSAYIKAERSVAENSGNAIAKYRNTTILPGTLQLTGYVDALCRGSGVIDAFWNKENVLLRMSRQALLHATKVRQHFLVDEAALTHPPGRWTNIVAPQLVHTIQVVQEDMAGENLYDFRIVPNAASLPQEEQKKVYDDTFALFTVEDTVTGFTDAWRDGRIFPAEGDKLDKLIYTWDQVGKIALDRQASLALMQNTLQVM